MYCFLDYRLSSKLPVQTSFGFFAFYKFPLSLQWVRNLFLYVIAHWTIRSKINVHPLLLFSLVDVFASVQSGSRSSSRKTCTKWVFVIFLSCMSKLNSCFDFCPISLFTISGARWHSCLSSIVALSYFRALRNPSRTGIIESATSMAERIAGKQSRKETGK